MADPDMFPAEHAELSDGWHHNGSGLPWALLRREAGKRMLYVWAVEDTCPQVCDLQKLFRLTPRQAQVTRMLVARRTNAEIADQLGITIHTARRHVEAAMLRLDATSRWDVERRVYEAAVAQAQGQAQDNEVIARAARNGRDACTGPVT